MEYTFEDACINELSLIFNDLNLVKLLNQYCGECVIIKAEEIRVIIECINIKVNRILWGHKTYGYYFCRNNNHMF